MTKDEAIALMLKGHKLTHKHFTDEEWITIKYDMFKFEDGCRCSYFEFWNIRTDDSWLTDWRIHRNDNVPLCPVTK